jgi:L-ascorbate metabolism protein UlaG (beta-lactamase superfamily)
LRIERSAAREGEKGFEIEKRGESCIDAVVICHEFTDHCHKDTLLELEREVPVFGTKVCKTFQ